MKAIVVIASVAALLALGYPRAVASTGVMASVGRLLVDGHTCTAFVARSTERPGTSRREYVPTYLTVLLTAGHCFGQSMAWQSNPFTERLYGYSVDRHAATHQVRLAALSPGRGQTVGGYDVAVLWFASPYYRIPALELGFAEEAALREGDHVLAVGYGDGVLTWKAGQFRGREPDGTLLLSFAAIPGMSGGPVFAVGSGRVVGIVIEGTLENPRTDPILCLFVRCALVPPTKATPISRVAALVSWVRP